MSYTLVNPFFEKSNISSNKQSDKDAAEDIWHKFSSNIKNYTPNFYFTIKNEESGAYSHYKVSENLAKNNKVQMKIKKLSKSKINNDILNSFVNTDNFSENSSVGSMTGGGHHKYKKHDLKSDDDSSDSSSDSSSDDLKIKRKSKGLKLIYSPGMYNVATIGLPIISSGVVSNVSLVNMLGFGITPGQSIAFLGSS